VTAKHSIERYYDRNTRAFLKFGGGGSSGAIHRQLWGPGVTSVHEASTHINVLLAEAIRSLALGDEFRVLDLGCGVGGTLLHLAEQFPKAELDGITISSRQHALAQAASADARINERCRFWLGDFETLRLEIKTDVVVAIESCVHSGSLPHFFATAAEHLTPDGMLIVIDDFVLDDVASGHQEKLSMLSKRRIADFQRGWQAPSFCSVERMRSVASDAGFALIAERDLSSLIRLGRPRDRVIARIAPLIPYFGLANVPFFGNMLGGNALQQGLREGLFTYRWLAFQK
jgi:cyclopropane fatty-acyl-phospholipid synthase-like methyltransferase